MLHTVHPDAKGRITLGTLAKGVDSFTVSQNKDGDIVLRPMASIPARELWLYQNKKALKSVLQGIKEIGEGKHTTRRSYAKYANIDLDE